jgi:hypothetical protein
MATTPTNTTSAKLRKPAPRKPAARKRPRAGAASSSTSRASSAINAGYAERAVLIPLGAALIARDRVLSGVNELAGLSPSKAQSHLRRFERRGYTARNRFEREVRKTRVRFERELRQRRQEIERKVTNLV